MASLIIKLGLLAVPLVVIATAYAARRLPLDAALLGIGGAVGFGCALIWILEMFGPVGNSKNPAFVIAAMALSPITVYGFAVLFGIRFFFTDLSGWPRSIYLVGTVVGLAPFLLMAVIAVVFVIGSAK